MMRNAHDTGPEGKHLNSYATVAPNFIKKEINEVTISCFLLKRSTFPVSDFMLYWVNNKCCSCSIISKERLKYLLRCNHLETSRQNSGLTSSVQCSLLLLFLIFHVVSRVKENRRMSPTGFSIFYVNNIVASSLLWASENIRVRRMDTFNLGF